jgi:hypothetical protein
MPTKIPTPADADRLRRLRVHSQSPDAPPPGWDDVRFIAQFLPIDLDNIEALSLPVMEHREIDHTVDDSKLFDQVSIDSGALKVGTDHTFPILRFMFTSTGPADPQEVVFVGPPLVLDGLRRLLRDAVRLAIRHANEGGTK